MSTGNTNKVTIFGILSGLVQIKLLFSKLFQVLFLQNIKGYIIYFKGIKITFNYTYIHVYIITFNVGKIED